MAGAKTVIGEGYERPSALSLDRTIRLAGTTLGTVALGVALGERAGHAGAIAGAVIGAFAGIALSGLKKTAK
jgi:hypothetical protein